jgi:anti-sigma B factor antagonist
MNMTTGTRQAGAVIILDISGRIVLGDETASLGKLLRDLLGNGHNKILVNLAGVDRVDTAGLAYLISAFTSVRKRAGELKLLSPTRDVRAVLQITKLDMVFDIRDDEVAAVKSFNEPAPAGGVPSA